MDKAFKAAWLISIGFYLFFNGLVLIQDFYINIKAESFDLDKNGFVDKNERSVESRKWMNKVANDTGRTFAPFVLIPVSVLAGTTSFFLVIIVERFKKT